MRRIADRTTPHEQTTSPRRAFPAIVILALAVAAFSPAAALAQAGYVLDGFGGIHAMGGAPVLLPATPYFGFDVTSAIQVTENGTGYYVLDSFGGIHAGGTATVPSPLPPYFGFSVARDFDLVSTPKIVAFGSLYHFGAGSFCGLQGHRSSNVVSATWVPASRVCDVTFSDFNFSINTHVAVLSGSVPGAIVGHQGFNNALRIYARTAADGDPAGGSLVQFVVYQ